MDWNDEFLALFDCSLERYVAGNHDFTSYFDEDDLSFLASIGYQPREFYDFVEDYADGENPTRSTSLLIASVRRDYFIVVMNKQEGTRSLTRDDCPPFDAELDGIAYLPRILKKARAKLRGDLDPDLMYDCGADRRFLREHGDIHPADFLRQVWAAGDDDHAVLAWVKSQAAAG